MKFQSIIPLLTCFMLASCDGAGVAIVSPPSLQDTHADGLLNFAADGTFVFDESARARFDYYSLAEGEVEDVSAWAEQELRTELPDNTANVVIDYWHRYIAYRKQAQNILSAPAEYSDDVATDTQRSLFAALNTYFATDEFSAVEFRSSEIKRIDRAFQLRAAHEIADTEVRQKQLAIIAMDDNNTASMAVRELQLRRSAKSTVIDNQWREHINSQHPGASERLALLKEQRSQWQQRVAQYSEQLEAMSSGFAGDPADLQQAVNELASQYFNAAEIRRVSALQRLGKI